MTQKIRGFNMISSWCLAIVALLMSWHLNGFAVPICVHTVIYLNRCPAELPCCSPRWVVDEQWFAVPKSPTPWVHPAAERSNRCLCGSYVVLLAIVVATIPTGLVVMMIRVMVAPMTAALTWTHAGHGTQRASQLPPCLAAGQLWPEARSAVAACCCTQI